MKREIRAFTMVEVLLYVSLVSIMLVVLSTFFGAIVQSRQRAQVIADVNEQGVQIMQILTQTIRNSTAITAPAVGVSASAATFTVTTAGLSPTVFDLNTGVIRMAEGAGTAIPLTSNRVTATSLTFTNLTRTGTKGTVRIQFTLSHVNPSNRREFNYSETFYGAATIK